MKVLSKLAMGAVQAGLMLNAGFAYVMLFAAVLLCCFFAVAVFG